MTELKHHRICIGTRGEVTCQCSAIDWMTLDGYGEHIEGIAETEIQSIVDDTITSMYHPEFGTEWREDGSLHQLVNRVCDDAVREALQGRKPKPAKLVVKVDGSPTRTYRVESPEQVTQLENGALELDLTSDDSTPDMRFVYAPGQWSTFKITDTQHTKETK